MNKCVSVFNSVEERRSIRVWIEGEGGGESNVDTLYGGEGIRDLKSKKSPGVQVEGQPIR